MQTLGLEVVDFEDGSYGRSIGLQKGDLIVSFNGQPLTSVAELREKISKNLGSDAAYIVIRAAEEICIQGKIASLGLILQPKEFGTTIEHPFWSSPVGALLQSQTNISQRANSSSERIDHPSPPGVIVHTRAGGNSSNEVAHSEYGVARAISKFISFVGWLIFVIGALTAIVGLFASLEARSRFGVGGISMLNLLPGLGISISGLFLIAAGQVTRATVDNADHTREILRILSKKA